MADMAALRLHPGEEIKESLVEFCRERGFASAYVATCVGSVDACELRLANADRSRPNEIVRFEDKRFEIVGFVGTLCPDGAHLHAALADATGRTIGGHLLSARVFTTAEIVVGNLRAPTRFERVYDDATGFDELAIVVNRWPLAFRLAGAALASLGAALLVMARQSHRLSSSSS